ncbi:hypothetical protein NitYY0826_C0209 [Nitratiruptor sp. YY08-26]|uniref:hypothetical protein n=1 Tax=unclassified Nitratiruptor TaxID=2624044 RepID=UPI001915226F|nr:MULTISPECIES: hypothetical protein [unclassified Nitratiruptor]BCD61370.1 hypothetical protein NitYY0813_C0209 [Nitratiruptor sp. YY08-13]BCD65303.1 hypothetical protein NitYY0826_C0209 [Nitratiruptor sp. YY08-26]
MKRFIKEFIGLLDRSYFASYGVTWMAIFVAFLISYNAPFLDTFAASAIISFIFAVGVTLAATLLNALFF